MWKKLTDCPQDDKNYLVCWRDSSGRYSRPHMAFFMEADNRFFSLENNNSHPLHVDIYCEVPEVPKE